MYSGNNHSRWQGEPTFLWSLEGVYRRIETRLLLKDWADAINAPAHFIDVDNVSGTGTATNNIRVQRDRAIPRQRSAFQIHAGGDCD
jgi:hypothetical protein